MSEKESGPPDPFDPAAATREEADLDSVDAINLIVLLDKKLGVEIPESDCGRIRTFQGMTLQPAGCQRKPSR